MRTVTFTKYLKQTLGLVNLFPNTIVDELESCTGVFNYDSDGSSYSDQGVVHFQFITANASREDAEKESMMILQHLRKLHYPVALDTNYLMQGIVVKQFMPIYLKQDQKGRHLFSFNITLFLEQQ